MKGSPIPKIKTNLVAGFLGSGKTSLIRHYLASPRAGERTAVLLNEAGEGTLDEKFLRNAGARAVELPGGCICCQVSNDFVVALKTLAGFKPGRILIESTGIAEPARILKALAESPSLRGSFVIDPTVVVVDTAGFFALFQTLAYYYVLQLRAADIIVLNKTDVATRTQISETEREIRKLNPKALLVRAVRGKADLWGMLEGGAGGRGYQSLSVRMAGTLDPACLRDFMERLPEGIYRAKGTVLFPDGSHRVQLLTGVYGQQPAEPAGADVNELVFIGSKIDKRKLNAALRGCLLEASHAN